MPQTPMPATPAEAREALQTVIDKNAEPFERLIAQAVVIMGDNLGLGVAQLVEIAKEQKEVNRNTTKLLIDAIQNIERLEEVIVDLKREIRDHDEDQVRHARLMAWPPGDSPGDSPDDATGVRPRRSEPETAED